MPRSRRASVLTDLASLLDRVAAGTLDEATVYRRERRDEAAFARRALRPGVQICPICGASAARFRPFGLFRRPNAQCPRCGSVERHRFLWLMLDARTDFFRRRLRVLHTAPEPCFVSPFRTLHGRGYVTVDRFDPSADVRADLRDLPFRDARFDVLVSSHVLEHVPEDGPALAELARVLRPGGWAAIMVPYDPKRPTREDRTDRGPAARMADYGHPWHWRIYGTDLSDRLRAVGLEPTVLDSRRCLTPHRRRVHRVNRNHLFLCRRVG